MARQNEPAPYVPDRRAAQGTCARMTMNERKRPMTVVFAGDCGPRKQLGALLMVMPLRRGNTEETRRLHRCIARACEEQNCRSRS